MYSLCTYKSWCFETMKNSHLHYLFLVHVKAVCLVFESPRMKNNIIFSSFLFEKILLHEFYYFINSCICIIDHESRYVDTVTKDYMLFNRGIWNGISGTMGEIKKKKTLITKWQLIMARFVDISSRAVLWNGHVVLTTGSTGPSGFIIWSWRWRWPQSNVGADRRNPQASCCLLTHRPRAWGRESLQPVVGWQQRWEHGGTQRPGMNGPSPRVVVGTI